MYLPTPKSEPLVETMHRNSRVVQPPLYVSPGCSRYTNSKMILLSHKPLFTFVATSVDSKKFTLEHIRPENLLKGSQH